MANSGLAEPPSAAVQPPRVMHRRYRVGLYQYFRTKSTTFDGTVALVHHITHGAPLGELHEPARDGALVAVHLVRFETCQRPFPTERPADAAEIARDGG